MAGDTVPRALSPGGPGPAGPGRGGKSRSSGGNSSDADAPKEIRTSEQTEDFMMNVYKLKLCPRSSSHDWRTCPYAHQGENAARRDHSTVQYLSVCCPESKAKRVCPRGNDCPFAHSMTEYFLHPSRYRTQMCNDGSKCTRPICFFAHSTAELRTPAYPSLNAAQLEALFSARASLAREDEAQLEQTLRACVIGPLPPLPDTVQPAPSGPGSAPPSTIGAGYTAATARRGGSGSGSGGMGTPVCASAATTFFAPGNAAPLSDLQTRYSAPAFDTVYSLGLNGDLGGVTYHPILHQASAPAGGLGGGMLGNGPTETLIAGGWGVDPQAAAGALFGEQRGAQNLGAVPGWMLQQQVAAQRQQQVAAAAQQQQAAVAAATAAAARLQMCGEPQHQQSLANLYQIQRLRDQLRAAEEVELAQMAQSEAAFSTQQVLAAAAVAAGPQAATGPRLGSRMVFTSGGGGGSGSGSRAGSVSAGAGGLGFDALSSDGGFSPMAPLPQQGPAATGAQTGLAPDLPPGLQALLAGAQQQQGPPSGPLLGSGFADLAGGGGAGGGLQLLPEIWGSGAFQADTPLAPQSAGSAPNLLQTFQQQQPSWLPRTFGDASGGPAAAAAPIVLGSARGGGPLYDSLDGAPVSSGLSFASLPGGGGSSSSLPSACGGPSFLQASSAGTSTATGASTNSGSGGGGLFFAHSGSGSFSGSGSGLGLSLLAGQPSLLQQAASAASSPVAPPVAPGARRASGQPSLLKPAALPFRPAAASDGGSTTGAGSTPTAAAAATASTGCSSGLAGLQLMECGGVGSTASSDRGYSNSAPLSQTSSPPPKGSTPPCDASGATRLILLGDAC